MPHFGRLHNQAMQSRAPNRLYLCLHHLVSALLNRIGVQHQILPLIHLYASAKEAIQTETP